MIKINLIKSAAGAAAPSGNVWGGKASEAESFSEGEFDEVSGPSWVVKLIIIFVGIVGLVAYENYNIPILQAQKNQKNKVLAKLKEENARVPDLVNEIQRFKIEKQKIEAQIKAIDDLSKDRLNYVKALDLIQLKTPQKLWFVSVKVNEGRIILDGVSATDAEISSLIESLSKNILFSEVNLLSAEDDAREKSAVKNKRFSIECVLEKS